MQLIRQNGGGRVSVPSMTETVVYGTRVATPIARVVPTARSLSSVSTPAPCSTVRGTMVGLGKQVHGMEAVAPLPSQLPSKPLPSQPLPSQPTSSLPASSPPTSKLPRPTKPPAAMPRHAAPASAVTSQPASTPAPTSSPASPPALFRQAAVDARRADAADVDLALARPRSWSLLLLLVSLVLASFVAAGLASVEVTAEAPGVLRAPDGLRAVASVLGGSVAEVLVHGGDVVRDGQVLARLEATELRASLTTRERDLELGQREMALAEQRDRQLEARAAQALARRRAATQGRLDINSERLEQRRVRFDDYAGLVKDGGASRAEGLSAKEAMQDAQESVSALKNELALLDLEISDRAERWRERESARRTELSRAQASVDEARALLAASEVKAPAAGQVESLLVTPGTVLAAGASLGYIVPRGAPRNIVAFVPSQEIAFIAPGAAATVEVRSLPVSEFGLGKARVTRVSSDVATPAEVTSLLGEPPTGAVVRVELELSSAESSPKLEQLLRSGERVQVRLHRRERRLLTLLFDFVQRWVS